MNSRSKMLATTLLTCAIALTACGGGGSADTPSGAATATVSSATSAVTSNQVATSAPSGAIDTSTGVTVVVQTVTRPDANSATTAGVVGLAVDDVAIGILNTRVQTTTQKEQLATRSTRGNGATIYLRAVFVNPSNPAASDSGSGSSTVPFRTITAAMTKLRPGDDVVIAPGTYRESVVVPALAWGMAKTQIRAQTPRSVLIKGSKLVAGWTSGASGLYWVDWSGDEPQQVFRAGVSLQQVGGTVFSADPSNPMATAHLNDGGIWPGRVNGGLNALTPDSFTYDAGTRRLYVKPAVPLTAGEALEVASLRHVLQAESAVGLTVQGIDFQHSNTSAVYRWGAVKLSGQQNVLTNLVVKDMDGTCVQLSGSDNVLSNSTIERCGQTGISGSGLRMTIANNRVTHSNTRGFNKWWEAGGMKLISDTGIHDSVIRNNLVAYNKGDGIWVDWLNTGNLIEGNTTAYNEGFGIHYEASQTGTIRGNLSYGNTMRGIYLFESANSLIIGNSVFGNVMEGIGVVDGPRSAGNPQLLPMNNTITGNAMAWNDFNRNWVQLVLPGLQFNNISDRNSFAAESLFGRMSMGFMGTNNPAFAVLTTWRIATSQDSSSTEQLMPMPATLKQAIGTKRLLSASEIPSFLAMPGMI